MMAIKSIKGLVLRLITILVFLVLLCASSYALWTYNYEGSNNLIQNQSIEIEFLESRDVINLTNAVPISDEQGMRQSEAFDFQVRTKTKSNMSIGYSIVLEKVEVDSGYTVLNDNQVKVYLTDADNKGLIDPTLVSDLEEYKIYKRYHKHSSQKEEVISKYRIRMWMDEALAGEGWDENTKIAYSFKLGVKSLEGETYDVVFNSNNESAEEKVQHIGYNEELALEKNTFEKEGYLFVGWATNPTGEVVYQDREKVSNLSGDGESITLYAVWELKEKDITMNIVYDTSTFSGPSSIYQESAYQTLSKSSATLKFGASETIISSPAYPDDRYEGSISCTNEIEARLTEGEGTTTREDTIKISNNSDTITDSVCTITYTPKWEGIEAGTYSGTTTYAGSTWTVKSDNGDNVGLALNGNAGSGSYKTDVQGDLANEIVNTDVTGGGIVGQSSGVYVSTDSDINTNYDSVGQVYWSGSGKVITNAAVTKYTLGTVVTYSSGHRSYNTNTGSGTVTYWKSTPFSTSYSSETLYDAGVSISVSDDNSTVLFSDAVLSSSDQGYMSDRYTNFDPDNTTAASSAKLPMRPTVYSGIDGSSLGSNYITNTKTWKLYDCGNEQHGKAYTFTAVDSTQYKYVSQTGASLTPAYSSYWTFYWAGGSVASTTTGTANSNLVRTYRFDQGDNCLVRTKYTTSDVEKDIYYRPYLIVRER